MEPLALLRTLGSLSVVLGLLGLALWAVKRFNLRLPGAVGLRGASRRRIEVIERLGLDGKRALTLIRLDGREHLLLLGPDGPLLIESGIVRDDKHEYDAVTGAAPVMDERRAALTDAVARMQARAGWATRADQSDAERFATLVEQAHSKVVPIAAKRRRQTA